MSKAGSELIDQIVGDVSQFFEDPQQVLTDPRFSHAQKLRILESWQTDAHLLSEATSENMGGGERSPLRAVELALESLKNDA